MYDPHLVKTLCISIALEKDPAESERLMNLLHAVMREDIEEVCLRLKVLKKLHDPILGAVANETSAAGCPWRIDTVGVKRIGSAKRAATKNASTR